MLRSFLSCNFHHYHWDDETEDKMQRHVYSIHKELRNAYKFCVRFEDFMVVTMEDAVFCDAMPCGSSQNQHFGGIYRLHHQDDESQRTRNNVSSN
jgi:hypothetical protein